MEAPFTLLEEQIKVLFGDSIVASEMSFGLVPEVLDPVNVIAIIGTELDGSINRRIVGSCWIC